MTKETLEKIALAACIGIVISAIVYFCFFTPCFQEGADSPEGTVVTFYKYLNAGEYSKARDLYDIDTIMLGHKAITLADDPEQVAKLTKNGSIDKVKIVSSRKYQSRKLYSNYVEEHADVKYEIVYKDGSSLENLTRALVKQHGCWVLDPRY
ncbi:MAG: hypothetical protein ACREAM_10780 [Blastocatellia bacterium]